MVSSVLRGFNMKRVRIYFDTSVLGGCFDREFQLEQPDETA
jgi:hypothetical protein